jgi:hypothetical protein
MRFKIITMTLKTCMNNITFIFVNSVKSWISDLNSKEESDAKLNIDGWPRQSVKMSIVLIELNVATIDEYR